MNIAEDELEICVLQVGPYQACCYIAYCPETGEAVVIDPGAEEARIAAVVKTLGLQVRLILATHGHHDHVMGARGLSRLLQAPVAMHEADVRFFRELHDADPSPNPLACPKADILLHDGQILEAGRLEIRALHTPGHTPGSCCFLCGSHLFTGDTLFVEGVGRTDLGGLTLQDLLDSIERKILPLPDAVVIHPGHDYGPSPASTLAQEKENNPYIRDFILDK